LPHSTKLPRPAEVGPFLYDPALHLRERLNPHDHRGVARRAGASGHRNPADHAVDSLLGRAADTHHAAGLLELHELRQPLYVVDRGHCGDAIPGSAC
jgi:hypothetical protein